MFRGRNGNEVATKTILVRLFLIQHPHADKEGQNGWSVGRSVGLVHTQRTCHWVGGIGSCASVVGPCLLRHKTNLYNYKCPGN